MNRMTQKVAENILEGAQGLSSLFLAEKGNVNKTVNLTKNAITFQMG